MEAGAANLVTILQSAHDEPLAGIVLVSAEGAPYEVLNRIDGPGAGGDIFGERNPDGLAE